MKVNVGTIVKTQGARVLFDGTAKMEDVVFGGNLCSFDGPFSISGAITGMGEVMQMEAHVAGVYKGICDRCGEEILLPFAFDMEERLSARESEDEEVIVISGNNVDVAQLALNNFFSMAPLQHLCQEDCKGLCQTCGTNLNEKECACTKDANDCRLSILGDLFKT